MNPIPTPPELSEADPPSEYFSEPPSDASSRGKKSKPGEGWWTQEPETTPEPTPKHTPKPTPPQSEEEEEDDDLEESDKYERKHGYLAWFNKYVASNGHEEPPQPEELPPVEPVVEEEVLVPMEAPHFEVPYPVAEEEEEELVPMDGVRELPIDEEGLESLWYGARNKNKRKKK